MSSKLFKQFIKKFVKQGAPGPPPRQGLRWKPQTHRWIRDREEELGPRSTTVSYATLIDLIEQDPKVSDLEIADHLGIDLPSPDDSDFEEKHDQLAHAVNSAWGAVLSDRSNKLNYGDQLAFHDESGKDRMLNGPIKALTGRDTYFDSTDLVDERTDKTLVPNALTEKYTFKQLINEIKG